MLKDIIAVIDKMEKTELKSLKFNLYNDIYNKFIVLLLLLMFLKIFLENIYLRKLT
jgi:hypothetical protein